MADTGDPGMDGNLVSRPNIGWNVHVRRIGLLMLLTLVLLSWLRTHTDVLFADGLRYIAQAQRFASGQWQDGVQKSIDHPIYPLAIAGSHWLRGGDGPLAWQGAAQAVSVLAGILLVVPLYLVCAELFGPQCAWLGSFLFLLAPQTGPILADVLSEGTFLLFWLWGLYAALRFLREGSFVFLPLVILFSGLAYMTRPEGLLLPAATVLTLLLTPLLRSTRLCWPRWWKAVGILVVGPLLIVTPYMMAKGGLATKPGIGRVLGLVARSPSDSVERARPIEPGETELQTYGHGIKAVAGSVAEMATPWLLPFAFLGFFKAFRPLAPRARVALMLSILLSASLFALLRLYVTGGYCTPRHAIAAAVLLVGAAGFCIHRIIGLISVSGRRLGLGQGQYTAGPAVWALLLVAYCAASLPTLLRPLNASMVGYRQAGDWLADQTQAASRVADATGWSLFSGQRSGYTFATLKSAPADEAVRWIVVRESHLVGPWWYCQVNRELVGKREPVAVFPTVAKPNQSRVLVFDRTAPETRAVSWDTEFNRRRR